MHVTRRIIQQTDPTILNRTIRGSRNALKMMIKAVYTDLKDNSNSTKRRTVYNNKKQMSKVFTKIH